MDYLAVNWLVPWHRCPDDDSNERTVGELRRELSESHALYGIPLQTIAYRQDCDDVLFELLDGSGRYAVVHLTYARHPELGPMYPETMIFENWDDFQQRGMQRDHDDFTEMAVPGYYRPLRY